MIKVDKDTHKMFKVQSSKYGFTMARYMKFIAEFHNDDDILKLMSDTRDVIVDMAKDKNEDITSYLKGYDCAVNIILGVYDFANAKSEYIE